MWLPKVRPCYGEPQGQFADVEFVLKPVDRRRPVYQCWMSVVGPAVVIVWREDKLEKAKATQEVCRHNIPQKFTCRKALCWVAARW